jgi:hypothetical protein
MENLTKMIKKMSILRENDKKSLFSAFDRFQEFWIWEGGKFDTFLENFSFFFTEKFSSRSPPIITALGGAITRLAPSSRYVPGLRPQGSESTLVNHGLGSLKKQKIFNSLKNFS